ncbi:DUF222 domain-containing protein, partial [Rhizobium johnstonii]|uniref:DUF222 domain-containing protein n=1 Tax=Rhizobium johnstonii TaxID=3019933 RepID=UPI003F9E0731
FELLTRAARGPRPPAASVLDVVADAIADAETARRDANRASARYFSVIADALRAARAEPASYLTVEGLRQRDAGELAERAAATDVALQLGVTPTRIRNDAALGETMRERLPHLWSAFGAGHIGVAQARAVVD